MRHPIALLAALACLLLPATVGPAATGDASTDPAHHFRGIDGLVYYPAPVAVPGRDDELFFGPDFDVACQLGGGPYVRAMKAVARLARVIENSGRRAIFTLGYNKSSVLRDQIDPSQLPHGDCDATGLAQQDDVVTHFKDPNYLPLVRPLEQSKHEVYFKTDVHWSSVGGSVFAKALATRLDPRLGRVQHYTYGTESLVGNINSSRGLDTTEIAETAFPDGPVNVSTAPGSTDWSGYPSLTYDYSWNSGPANLTWPGHTLLLGDSFTMFALENLRPIFRHGQWMWFSHNSLDDVATAIKGADTVVIEIFELFTPKSVITSNSFLRKLRRVLQ